MQIKRKAGAIEAQVNSQREIARKLEDDQAEIMRKLNELKEEAEGASLGAGTRLE